MRSDSKRLSLVGLLQTAAVLTIAFSLLTSFGTRNPYLELFTHFRLQYLAVSLLLLFTLAALRSYLYAGALLVTAIGNSLLVVPWYFDEPPAATGAPLKLVHVNVHASNSDYDRLLDFVAAEDPDVIFLQEVTPEWVAGSQGLRQEYPYTYAEPRSGNFGIAAYSRIPFETIRHIDSPPFGYPTLVARVAIADQTVTLVSTHPTIPIRRELYEARNEQLQSVGQLVAQLDGNVVLIGDFNASIWDPEFHRLEQTTGLRDARQGFGVLPSWPTFMPFAMIPIDHALVSEDIAVLDIRTGRRIGSDPLPLVVTVSM